jgi:hypothetical protein
MFAKKIEINAKKHKNAMPGATVLDHAFGNLYASQQRALRMLAGTGQYSKIKSRIMFLALRWDAAPEQ